MRRWIAKISENLAGKKDITAKNDSKLTKKATQTYLEDLKKSDKKKIEYLLSRTPQILQILNNKTNIIRSSLQNTLIHQPRTF